MEASERMCSVEDAQEAMLGMRSLRKPGCRSRHRESRAGRFIESCEVHGAYGAASSMQDRTGWPEGLPAEEGHIERSFFLPESGRGRENHCFANGKENAN